jgi:hypothetical protein
MRYWPPFTLSKSTAWLLAIGIVVAGCGRKPGPTQDQGKSALSHGVSVENLASAPAPDATPAPPPPPAESVVAPAGQPSEASKSPGKAGSPAPKSYEITSSADISDVGAELKGNELATPQILETYNRRLAMVNFRLSDYPESLEQLKKWPMMPPPPKPPPGKKIVYDARLHLIRLDPP